jgi:hypothetical protein
MPTQARELVGHPGFFVSAYRSQPAPACQWRAFCRPSPMRKQKRKSQPTPKRTSWVERLKATKDGLVAFYSLVKIAEWVLANLP